MKLSAAIACFNNVVSEDCSATERACKCNAKVLAMLETEGCLDRLSHNGSEYFAVTPIGLKMGMAYSLPSNT